MINLNSLSNCVTFLHNRSKSFTYYFNSRSISKTASEYIAKYFLLFNPSRLSVRCRTQVLKRRRSNSGVAALEMTLVLPVLLFFIVAFIDIGRALHARFNIIRAAYEGVRYGMRLERPIDPALVQNRIEVLLNRRGITLPDEKIKISIKQNEVEFDPNKADLITAEVSYPFRYLFSFLGTKEIVALTSSTSVALE